MRTVVTAFISVFFVSWVAAADDLNLHAWQMESKGDPAGAREFLERSAQSGSADSLEAITRAVSGSPSRSGARRLREAAEDRAGSDQRSLCRQPISWSIPDLVAGDRDTPPCVIWNSTAQPVAAISTWLPLPRPRPKSGKPSPSQAPCDPSPAWPLFRRTLGRTT